MPAMPTIEEIVRSIDKRLEEATKQIVSLTSARAALGPNNQRHVPTRVRKQRSRVTANAQAIPAGMLEQLLSASDGLSTSALAQQANGDRDAVLARLRELEAAGRVHRTGERRGVRWHAITDEDWINERAAELERQSKRRRRAAHLQS